MVSVELKVKIYPFEQRERATIFSFIFVAYHRNSLLLPQGNRPDLTASYCEVGSCATAYIGGKEGGAGGGARGGAKDGGQNFGGRGC